MHIRLITFQRNLFATCCKISKRNMDLEKCYFRHLKNENEMHITFLLKLTEDKVRQFNFTRKPDETLDAIMHRIRINVEKFYCKGNKKKIKHKLEEDDVKLVDIGGTVTPNTTCLELLSTNTPVKLKVMDNIYNVVYNTPWITNVSLPQCILVGFPIFPTNLVSKFCSSQHNKFYWYSSNTKIKMQTIIEIIPPTWELVSTGYAFTPTVNEIGKKIKLECIPGNAEQQGPAVEIVSIRDVDASPGRCPFENRHEFTTTSLSGKSFRCVTYNILANLYCESDYTKLVLHPYCPSYALHIEYRNQLLNKELLGYNADIICLQEVGCSAYTQELQPMMNEVGLEGVFAKKGYEVAEGLACFYRKERFRLMEHKSIVVGEAVKTDPCLSYIWLLIKDNEPLVNRLCVRSTVTSATVLQSLENPNHVLIVGNTHLYFHPDADHIRLLQAAISIFWLKNIINEMKQLMPHVSLIMCGDFNSVPSCGIYKLFTEGCAPSDLPDWKSNKCQTVVGVTLEQDIPLKSACGTPKYTNFTTGFADCLDYIFYDTANLDVEQVIPLPSDEELTAHTALPSVVFPSDHIALVADLKFKH